MSVEIVGTGGGPSAPPRLEASISASELRLFSRDLRGTVTDVVVAAAGRALAAHPEIRGATRSDAVGIGVAVDTQNGVLVPVVRNASDAPLPEIRAEVRRLVDAARAGELSSSDIGEAAVTVHALEPDAGTPREYASIGCALTVDRTESDSPDITVAFTVDGSEVGGAEASQFFATLVRLLRQPYRRLA